MNFLGSQLPERVLVIRLSSIGDIMLTTPVLRAFHTTYPGIQIDYLIKDAFRDLVEYHPGVDRVRSIPPKFTFGDLVELRREIQAQDTYDWILDLHDNLRSRMLTALGDVPYSRYNKDRLRRWLFIYWKIRTPEIETYITDRYFQAAEPLGLQDDGNGLDLYFPEDFRFHSPETDAEVEQFRLSDYPVTVGPGAAWATKQWPPERFAALCDTLVETRDATLGLVGGPGEEGIGHAIRTHAEHTDRIYDFIGNTSLLGSAKIMDAGELHIGNDSGLTHIATALKKPVVLILGSTAKPTCFYPKYTEYTIVEDETLRCRPCTHMGRKRCPLGHFHCMKNLDVEEVMSGIRKMAAV